MKRTPLFFVIAFALLALAIMPSARMEVSPKVSPTLKNAVAPAAITAAPVPPPTVSLTSPFNNAQFLAGATIRLTANAADSDGTISKVEFYQGAVKLATDTASPYEYDWVNVTAGNYVLTAVATDNQSQATTSSAINVAVLAQVKQLVGWSSITNGTDLGNGSVRKTSTGAWDFTAVALQTLLAGDAYFESTAANFNQSISLTGANGQSRAIVVGSGGWVGIYEGSTEVAATVGHIPAETITPHAAGDRYRIEITNSIVRYIRYRGAVREVMFQSAAPLPTYPMAGGLGISPQNAEWQKTVLAQLTRKATWSAIVNGVDLGNGTVQKTSTGTWDFSATAAQTLARGDGYFESTASYWNHSINASGSDGAARSLLVGTGGWAAIYEGGVEVASTSPLGNLSAHAAGDRYRLEISGSQFRYVRYRGGIRTVIFTSPNAVPGYPITFSLGMSFQNSEWQNTVFAQLSNTVTWSSISNGIDLGNGSVRKTSTGTWDFSSVARQQMVFGPGYFESTASNFNHSINLWGSDGAGRSLLAGTGGWAAIYENNVEVASTSPLGNLTAHAAGDRYRLELISGKLRYVRYRGGARMIAFTSTNAVPPHPLAFSLGMSFQNSEWQNTMFSDNVPEHNDASFVSQSVPATMTPGQMYSVIVVMRNTGASTWTPDGDYQLGSENLSDNTRWGPSRVNLNATVRPGEDATFSFMVTAPAAGSHSFQWRMVQNGVQRFGALTTNVNVNTVNNPPTVSLTGPAQGATFTAPATVPFTATASDSDGTITKVEFFQGTTKVGEDTTSPYTFNWPNVAAGSYVLSAKATDSGGATATSSTVNITVNPPNQAPTVSLTAPTAGQIFSAPASITLTANANDADGIVTKVQFFRAGTTLIAEDTSAPFTFAWNSVAAGNYSLTAKAFDNAGATTTSAAVAITVNALPTVSMTAPTNNQVFAAPASITLTASASDSDGSITKIQFYNGTTLLNEDTLSPYTFGWGPVGAGTYNLTAKAFDNLGGTTTSSVIAITVNTLPTCSITSPTHPTTFTAPASFTISATASDPGGSITKVEFFDGATLLGQDTTSPYTFNVSNLSSGTHVLTAKATDNLGGTTTSSAVNAVVTNAPTTSITSPANNASFLAGANITINASASDSDGSIAKVEFFRNGVLLGEDTASPYSFTWNTVPEGTYSLTTRATDNLGVTGTSAPVNVNVNPNGISRLDPINRIGGANENPFSRNYNWTMPLLNLPGRAELNLGLSLSYNSLVWTKSGSNISFDADKGFPSPGFRLGFPVIQGPFFNSDANKNIYILITPDGSRVELRQFNSTTLYEAVDSSYLLLDASTMVLRGYDGTQMSYELYGTDFQCKEIKDRNGNFITINRAADGRINTIVDTLSRTINFVYNGTTLTSITQSWTVNGSPVTHTWASFQYRNPDLTINTNFSGLTNIGPQNGSTLKVLSGVTLGDNSRFEFEYTSWGQVWKISQFANDGQTLLNYRSYDLPLNNTNPQSDCPRFTQRRDWAKYWNRDAGGTEQEAITSFLWQANASWTMPPSGAADSGILSQVTLPDGTINKFYSHATGWDKGLPVLTETYDNLQVRQRQTTNAWTQDDTQLTVPKNPRVTETNTFDPAGNRKRVRVEYQTFTLPNQTQCTLPRDFFEYKNATTVLRSTRTTYNHDSAFTTRRMIDLVGEQAVYDGDVTLGAPLVSKFTYGYDESGSIEAIPTPAVQHDAAYGTNFVLGRANLSSVKRHDLSNSTQVTITSNKYNITGAMVSTKDALDHGVTFSYTDAFAANGTTLDAPRSFATLAYPTTINDAGGNSLTARYNYDFGAITLRQTPLPNQTAYTPGPQETFTYDSAGRIERVTSLANNARQRYLYGPNYVQSWSTVNNVADELLSVEVKDGAGRLIATAKNHPGSQGGFSAETVVFDVMGRAVKRSNPTETSITISSAPINPYAWLPNGDDSTWYFTQQTYDWKGRPLVTTNPDATTRTASYSGCGCAGGEVLTLTDEGTIDPFDLVTPKKRQKKIYSDVLGREVKSEVLNWEGGSVVSATVTNYNARDQIKMVRQFAGAAPTDLDDLSCPAGTCQKTDMTYDGQGRLKTRHTPEEQNDPNNPGSTDHTTWDYNADDTIQKMTDPRGAVTNYAYNSRHRITNITYTLLPNVPTTGPSGVATAAAVGYEYDAAGNRKRMTDGLGEVNYTYDQLSRLTSETRFFSNLSNSPTGGNYTLGYEYNFAGQVTKVTDPNNVQVHYGFDNAGRLSGVTGTGFTVSTFLSNIQYRAWGAPKSVAHVNNRTTETTYDERLRVKTYKLLPSVPDDGIKLHNQYDYFPDGRLKKLTDLDDHDPTIIGFTDSGRWFTRVYRYDNHGRILRARGHNQPNNFEFDRPYDLSYGYDSFNHLVSRSGKYYYQTGFSDSGTFVNNRRQGWDYAADGQEIHLTETGMFRDLTYNAAGKMVQVKETVTATNVFSTYVVSYDGDGHTAREFFQEDPANSNTYHLRSSVLGRVITRLNNAGNKTGTTVHLDNKVTTARINSTDTGNVPFPTYEDPLRYSIAGDKKAVYDPLGNHIPWQSSPQSNPPPFYPRSSASFGSLGSSFGSAQERGCVLDGVPTNCDRAMRMVNSGSAMVDPSSSNRQQLVENGFLDYWVYMGEERGFERQQYFLHNFRQGPQQAQPQQPTPQELFGDCRVQAMLDAIAWAEGTAGDADDGYGRVVRGTVISSPNNPALVGQTNVTITNFAQHPNILVQVTQTIRSTAAGRYQFLNRTWTGLNLPDFGRYNQDIGAIMLLQQAGAITPLLNGNVRQAAANANGTWASLPNSPLGQPTRAFADFESAYNDSLVDCVIRQFRGLP